MIIKNKIIILIFILFVNCGYQPLLTTDKIGDIYIKNIDFEGDNELNNFLKINLKKYSKEKNVKKIQVYVKTEYSKNEIIKDATGSVAKFEIKAKVIFLVIDQNSKKDKIIITENFTMNRLDDLNSETKYERIIKQNFASSISNKLIIELLKIK